MKALTCEMCGSTNLIKEGDVFICQSCGTKYSVEAAKKMMVEGTVNIKGTVKVDSSEELKNLYALARRAKATDDSANARKYYDMILLKDPQSWEATFYSTYYTAMSCKIAEIESAGIKVQNCIAPVIGLIKKLPEEEQVKSITTIYVDLRSIANMLYNAAYNHFEGIDPTIQQNYVQEMIDNCVSGETILDIFANTIEREYGDKFSKLYCECWKKCIEMRNKIVPHLDKDANSKLLDMWADKIKKYESDYVRPETNSSGCYVATAVYGSYDCPPVWTLRRFRDYTLDETWYGRVFIHIYYAISPTLVHWFGDTTWFKTLWRMPLDKLVNRLNRKGVASTPYADKY